MTVIHVQLNQAIRLPDTVEASTVKPRCLVSSLLMLALLPRPRTLPTPINDSHRPLQTIAKLLDILWWWFQKDKFVFPGMRVR